MVVSFFVSLGKTDPGLNFIENKNQWPKYIDFVARVPGGDMAIQPGRFTFIFTDNKKLEEIHERSHGTFNESDGSMSFDTLINGHTIQINFLNSNLNPGIQTFGLQETYYNYFLSSDSSTWASKARSFSGVVYSDFYKGIDLKVYSEEVNLKYDYVLAPYADPTQIKVSYDGADNVHLDNGNLYYSTTFGEIIEKKPYAFQFIEGKKVSIICQYILEGNVISFSFPQGYDPCYQLTIDPLLIFSTYSGSTADNWGSTATPGEHGKLYSAGVTNQETFNGKFPTTPGAFQKNYGGDYDVAILKYDSLGKQLLYASYLGGSFSESPHSLIMNEQEELIVLGTTSSFNFPTSVDAFDRSFNGGDRVKHVVEYKNGSDIFVARISADGATLLASTYLGGSRNDGLNARGFGLVRNYGDELRGDVITDADGNIYVSTVTSSNNFPVVNGLDLTYNNGSTDALLLKLNKTLSTIIWGTYIGGNGTDASHTLKFADDGSIFLAGGTNSSNFPATTGAYQTTKAGREDGWIAKIKSTGDSIIYATYTGTSGYDQIYFLDLNDAQEVYVYGQTDGNFPVSPGVYSNPHSGQFIQKFDNQLSKSIFSTVFGSGSGIPDISPTAFLVSECNNIYMSGWGGIVNSVEGFWDSNTKNMKVSNDAFQKKTSGSDFYFISLTDDASEFLYATYLGGTQSRTHVDGGTSRFDKSGIVYHAVCSGCAAFNASGKKSTSDFPTTAGVWSRTNKSKNCNNAAFKFDLSVLKARLQSNSISLDMPGLNVICIPDGIVFQNKCIGGETYQWDLGDGTKISLNKDTSRIVHYYKSPGQYKVKLKAIDLATCIGIDSASTTIYVYESLSKVQADSTYCAGATHLLTASGGSFYDWRSNDGVFESHDSETTHVIEPKDSTIYYVAIKEASGCIHKDTVNINIIPDLLLNFKWKYNLDCFSRPPISFSNLTKGRINTDQFLFDFGDGETSDLDHVVHTYSTDDVYHVKLIGNREFCSFEKPVDIHAFTLKVPNVITPDGSIGKNDKFVLQYGETINDTPKSIGLKVSLVIYNRWGKVVFESKDYQYDWDGGDLASGVYYYEAEIEDLGSCKDWIQIIR